VNLRGFAIHVNKKVTTLFALVTQVLMSPTLTIHAPENNRAAISCHFGSLLHKDVIPHKQHLARSQQDLILISALLLTTYNVQCGLDHPCTAAFSAITSSN
jgi:hypothetical protein